MGRAVKGGRQRESNRARKCLFPWCFVKFLSAVPPYLPPAVVWLLLAVCGLQWLPLSAQTAPQYALVLADEAMKPVAVWLARLTWLFCYVLRPGPSSSRPAGASLCKAFQTAAYSPSLANEWRGRIK
jgi:hypothetical protein